MNQRRNTTLMRVFPEDKEKIKQLALELSAIQKAHVHTAEALRRTLKTADKTKLLTDAEIKRWLR